MITYEQFAKAVESGALLWAVDATFEVKAFVPSDFNAHAFYSSFFEAPPRSNSCVAKVIDTLKNCYDLGDVFLTSVEADEEVKRRLTYKLTELNKGEKK